MRKILLKANASVPRWICNQEKRKMCKRRKCTFFSLLLRSIFYGCPFVFILKFNLLKGKHFLSFVNDVDEFSIAQSHCHFSFHSVFFFVPSQFVEYFPTLWFMTNLCMRRSMRHRHSQILHFTNICFISMKSFARNRLSFTFSSFSMIRSSPCAMP